LKAVTTGWTWAKYERAEGQKVLPQVGCGHKIEDKIFPYSQVEGLWGWNSNSISVPVQLLS